LLTAFGSLITKEIINDHSSEHITAFSSLFFIPITIGYFSHLLTDSFTVQGVP
jgi:hypothetical protein